MGPSQYDTMARKVWEKLPTLYQKLYIITVNMWLSIETLRYLNSQNFPRNLTNIPADFKKLCCTSWTCLTLQTIKFLVECALDVFISIVFFFFFFTLKTVIYLCSRFALVFDLVPIFVLFGIDVCLWCEHMA